MLPEGNTRTLTEAARQLGVEPFELVRLLVASGRMPLQLVVEVDTIEVLRRFGRIERWWDEGIHPLADDDVRVGLLRAVLGELLTRGHVEPSTTRRDNLWRGLPVDQQEVVQVGLQALEDEELIRVDNVELGTTVTVPKDASARIRAFVSGKEPIPAVAEALGA